MKKFILFQYYDYYQGGGLSDITNSFAEKKPRDTNEVVDRDTWGIVWESQ